ncbi:type I-B CRISPR-associated endonuclease Cas1b [Thermosediminibacter oceani]|uniref:CRISPR-associated endonuclease Cas1 n=1 Tax=Thermosediminibacter oceani (strain ATCC BAA-1034 / DSM 16646 / JW/IW-1228P) TaxID=555079 RepID=D9RZG9_THEOJ|nr:type I-B CRISPR-associated endonuclease Cas1b [Thermosediminibacter oceani]ADL06867.1 CRISPR-associated protein, Cas1 family [Thermosediminibacter oceani DSM 16646]
MKKAIYIFSSGELKRKDNTLYLETEDRKNYIPVENTSEIYIFGEVNINKRFLEFASQNQIIIHFFNHYDYYVGSFYPREFLNSGYMILKQAEYYLDKEKRLTIAREFVRGAVKNILQVIRYYINRGKDLVKIDERIRELEGRIDDFNEIDELMAIEGNIRECYYSSFDKILQNQDFKFCKRTTRPPKNNLNSLISFGNSMIYTIVLSEIYKTHLDPRIGFLHATNFRRFTLNLDVAEIFKPIIVDRVILTLIGRKVITKDDFEQDSEGLIIKEKAKREFIKELEEKLSTTFKHRQIGKNVSYRRLIRLELYKLEKHLMGEQEYSAFVAGW